MSARDNLAIVDDDDAVRDSLRLLLRGNGFDVAAFASAEALIEHLDAGETPACIVSDVRMAGMSGLDLLGELRRRGTPAPVILITGHGQISMAVAAIKAGADDFIEKPFDEASLVEAIRSAIDKAARAASARSSDEDIRARIGELSQRQREVMDLVIEGFSSKEIAARLGISPRTVETYRLWIMEKMAARNLADLVRKVSRVL